MIKSFSFIVLTHFFQFNQLKILRQPGYYFFKLNQQYFFTVYSSLLIIVPCMILVRDIKSEKDWKARRVIYYLFRYIVFVLESQHYTHTNCLFVFLYRKARVHKPLCQPQKEQTIIVAWIPQLPHFHHWHYTSIHLCSIKTDRYIKLKQA